MRGSRFILLIRGFVGQDNKPVFVSNKLSKKIFCSSNQHIETFHSYINIKIYLKNFFNIHLTHVNPDWQEPKNISSPVRIRININDLLKPIFLKN